MLKTKILRYVTPIAMDSGVAPSKVMKLGAKTKTMAATNPMSAAAVMSP